MVERLFLAAVPQGCLQFVIVVFPDHTNLLFLFEDIQRVCIASHRIALFVWKLVNQLHGWIQRGVRTPTTEAKGFFRKASQDPAWWQYQENLRVNRI